MKVKDVNENEKQAGQETAREFYKGKIEDVNLQSIHEKANVEDVKKKPIKVEQDTVSEVFKEKIVECWLENEQKKTKVEDGKEKDKMAGQATVTEFLKEKSEDVNIQSIQEKMKVVDVKEKLKKAEQATVSEISIEKMVECGVEDEQKKTKVEDVKVKDRKAGHETVSEFSKGKIEEVNVQSILQKAMIKEFKEEDKMEGRATVTEFSKEQIKEVNIQNMQEKAKIGDGRENDKNAEQATICKISKEKIDEGILEEEESKAVFGNVEEKDENARQTTVNEISKEKIVEYKLEDERKLRMVDCVKATDKKGEQEKSDEEIKKVIVEKDQIKAKVEHVREECKKAEHIDVNEIAKVEIEERELGVEKTAKVAEVEEMGEITEHAKVSGLSKNSIKEGEIEDGLKKMKVFNVKEKEKVDKSEVNESFKEKIEEGEPIKKKRKAMIEDITKKNKKAEEAEVIEIYKNKIEEGKLNNKEKKENVEHVKKNRQEDKIEMDRKFKQIGESKISEEKIKEVLLQKDVLKPNIEIVDVGVNLNTAECKKGQEKINVDNITDVLLNGEQRKISKRPHILKMTEKVDIEEKVFSEQQLSGRIAENDKTDFRLFLNQKKSNTGVEENCKFTSMGKDIPEKSKRTIKGASRKTVSTKIPSFELRLTNRVIPINDSIKIMCSTSNNEENVQWFKDNKPIISSMHYIINSQNGIYSFEIPKATFDDSGIYTCVVRNKYGVAETSSTIIVFDPTVVSNKSPPVFTRGIKDSYNKFYSQLILECKISGNPLPRTIWLKNNVPLNFNGKFKIYEQSNGIMQLIISDVTEQDNGVYTCIAENCIAKTKFDKIVNVLDYITINQDKNEIEKRNTEFEKNIFRFKSEQNEMKHVNEFEKHKSLLSFGSSLKNFTTQEDNTVVLECMVTGYLDNVIWLKDDKNIDDNKKYRTYKRENGHCTLEIFDTVSNDSGTYTCRVCGPHNEIECSSKLLIYEKLNALQLLNSFSNLLKDKYDSDRNELSLECIVRGRPKIFWYKNGSPISNNRYREIEETGGIKRLLIRNPVQNDFGNFACRTVEFDKIEEISLNIDNNNFKYKPSSFYPSAVDINGDTKHFDDYNALKKRLDKSIKPIRRYKMPDYEIHYNSLNRLINTIAEPSRKYEVWHPEEYYNSIKRRMHLPIESSNYYERDISLRPQNTSIRCYDTKKRPVFSTHLMNRTAAENSTIKLTCNILGDFDTNIFWLKNNSSLPSSTKYRTLYDDGLASLEIFSVLPNDSGNYTCVAKNLSGETYSNAHLKVYKGYEATKQSPVFTRLIKDNYYLNENELVLDCRIRGNPRPEIQWFKGNDIITPDDKYQQFDQADGYCKLVIYAPTEKDSGTYTCSATNEVSSDKISHTVEFGGREKFILSKTHGFFHRDPNKPHFTTHFSDHMVTLGGTIGLSAEFAPTSSPIDVQWLRNKVPISGQPNIKTFFEHGVYTLAIEKATVECSGVYTCRASNAFGKIESHSNIHIVGPSAKGGGKAALFLSRPEPEMKIAVNDPFSISFRVQGEPKPKLILMKGTKDITKSDRVSKEASDDYIRFTLHKSQISDSGTYFIVARNQHGTDRIFTTVTIKNPKKK